MESETGSHMVVSPFSLKCFSIELKLVADTTRTTTNFDLSDQFINSRWIVTHGVGPSDNHTFKQERETGFVGYSPSRREQGVNGVEPFVNRSTEPDARDR
jgi:hypothetical protein